MNALNRSKKTGSGLTVNSQASSCVRRVEKLLERATTSVFTFARLIVTPQASSSVRPVERLSYQAATSVFTRTRLTVTSQASLCDLCGKDCSDKPCLSLHIHIYHCAHRDFNQASSSVRPVERLSEPAAASASTRTWLTINSQVLLCLCPQIAQDLLPLARQVPVRATTSACTRTRLTVTSQASSSVRPVERLSEPAAASASTRTRLTVTSQASNLCDLCGKDCSDKPCLSLHIHIYHCARRDFNQASSCETCGKNCWSEPPPQFSHSHDSSWPLRQVPSSSVRPVERLHSHSTHRKLSGPTLSLPTSCPRRPRWTPSPRRRTACCISSPTPSCGSRSPCTCCRW